MIGQRGIKFGLVVLGIVLLAAAGCAKKQTVRSNESTAPQTATNAPAPGNAPPGGISTETLPPEAPPPSPIEAGALTQPQPSPFQDIHFDFDKSFIREADRPTLEKVAEYLKSHSGTRVLIEGNCDERGTEEYNMMLGDRRANAARQYLVDLGVPGKELSTISFGKDKPVDPGHDEMAWAKNRNDHVVTQ